ncbi:hypothetical protein [Microbispora sp. CA-102843]|uniref:hypothetical protein n=1 Tax=Microbispora sp. CA-102843 TaxID=3239952 RepID=UPI003D8AEB2D
MLPASPRHRIALQAGMALGLVDPIVGSICGKVPFRGPFPIGHECVTEVAARGALAAYGFGPAGGPWGGMVADRIRVPHADHMLVPVPDGVPPIRVAAGRVHYLDDDPHRRQIAEYLGAEAGPLTGTTPRRLRHRRRSHLTRPGPAARAHRDGSRRDPHGGRDRLAG